MSELTYTTDRPLARGDYITVDTPYGRPVVLKVLSVTRGDDRVEAWEAVTGHQVPVRIVEAVA